MAEHIMPQSNITEGTQVNFGNWWLWLTLPIVFGTLIAAVSGFMNPSIYRNSLSLAVQGQGQDLVTFLLVLPMLVISTFFTAQNSLRGRIVWLGTMVYLVYTYIVAAFQVEFNNLFLIYVMLVGCTFYSIIFGFMTIRWNAVKFSEKTPVRTLSILMIFIVIAYYGLWLSDVIPAIHANTVPAAVARDNIPTSAVHVLDMGLFLPLMVIGAIWLWQQKRVGYVIAGISFTFGFLMSVAVIGMVLNMARMEVVESIFPVVIFGVTTLLTGGALWVLLRHTES